MIRQYEIMTITKSALTEDEAREVSNSVKDIITSLKGKVLDSDFIGKKKFAYIIKGDTEGYYDVIDFEVDSEKINQFKKKLNLEEKIIRYLITVN